MLEAYPTIFNLMSEYGGPKSNKHLITLNYLTIQELPALLLVVYVPSLYLRFHWGVKKLPFYFTNKKAPDGKFVASSLNVVSGATPPTISVDPDWWTLEDHPVVSENTADTKVARM